MPITQTVLSLSGSLSCRKMRSRFGDVFSEKMYRATSPSGSAIRSTASCQSWWYRISYGGCGRYFFKIMGELIIGLLYPFIFRAVGAELPREPGVRKGAQRLAVVAERQQLAAEGRVPFGYVHARGHVPAPRREPREVQLARAARRAGLQEGVGGHARDLGAERRQQRRGPNRVVVVVVVVVAAAGAFARQVRVGQHPRREPGALGRRRRAAQHHQHALPEAAAARPRDQADHRVRVRVAGRRVGGLGGLPRAVPRGRRGAELGGVHVCFVGL
ncbi:ORF142 [Saltwater crocodilepox virus]|nr:ORF142 [Saltwater crocodilepox virus]